MIRLEDNLQVLEAVRRLSRVSEFQLFIDHLRLSREAQRDANEEANGNEIYRGSGRSLELKDILSEVDESRKTLEALQRAGGVPEIELS